MAGEGDSTAVGLIVVT